MRKPELLSDPQVRAMQQRIEALLPGHPILDIIAALSVTLGKTIKMAPADHQQSLIKSVLTCIESVANDIPPPSEHH
jgi:hypothetical protein